MSYMEPFTIVVPHNGSWLRFKVQYQGCDRNSMRFTVIGANGEIIIACDKPLIERAKIQYRKLNWRLYASKQLKGAPGFINVLGEAIERKMNGLTH